MGTAMVQGDLWSGSPLDWAELQEPLFTPIYEAVLKTAAVGKEQKVLDVGCGSGFFCQIATKRGAHVAGIDAAPKLIEIARERTPKGDFHVGEMEELPFSAASFDVVTGFNSFQFAADPVNALRQAQRVTKPSGKIVVAVWGAAKDCEAAAFLKALGSTLPPPPPGAPGPFALSDQGVLEALLSKAGLKPQASAEVDTPFIYKNDDAAWRAIVGSGPGVRAIRHSGEAKVREAVMPAISSFKKADGSYRFENKFRYVLAHP
jgi:SAM-dependent methyltransferase